MFRMTKAPIPSTPMDSSNVSALMCGQVLPTVVWLGLSLPSSSPPNELHLSSGKNNWAKYWKMCHWRSDDASCFNTMARHTILQVHFVINLTNVYGATMDRPRRPDYMTSTIAKFNTTWFFLRGQMKSLVYQTTLWWTQWKIYLHEFWVLHKRFNRHQV